MGKRYAIIGSGMMGQEHIRNLHLIEGAEVVAVADPDEGMRSSAAAVAGPACRSYADHRALLSDEALDSVVVAAPNHLHAPIMADLLVTELAILCEKPLGLDPGECVRMAELARTRKAPVWVAMEYRYMPPIARLIAAEREGAAGRARMLTIREHRFPFLEKPGAWNRFSATSGGTLVEKCCHFFDLMRLILRAEPTRVFASGAHDVNFLDVSIGGQIPDMLDNAFVLVDFDSGARAMLDLCMFAEGAFWQEEVSLTGDQARLDARVPGPARFQPGAVERPSEFVISPRSTKDPIREVIETDPKILRAGDHHGATFYQHQRFFDMLSTGAAPDVTLDDGLIAVAVGAAAEESARTGLPVSLVRDRAQERV